MKTLIKKILREENESPLPTEEAGISLLRVVLQTMKSIPQSVVDNYIPELQNKGPQSADISALIGPLENIVKLIGVDSRDSQGYIRHNFGDRNNHSWQIAWWFVETFLRNGGYNRNFSEGEIILPEIPIYECEVEYVEKVFESRLGWGDIMGVTSEEEAAKKYMENPYTWQHDSEHQDSEYGDLDVVEEGEVTGTRILKFNPTWVGVL